MPSKLKEKKKMAKSTKHSSGLNENGTIFYKRLILTRMQSISTSPLDQSLTITAIFWKGKTLQNGPKKLKI